MCLVDPFWINFSIRAIFSATSPCPVCIPLSYGNMRRRSALLNILYQLNLHLLYESLSAELAFPKYYYFWMELANVLFSSSQLRLVILKSAHHFGLAKVWRWYPCDSYYYYPLHVCCASTRGLSCNVVFGYQEKAWPPAFTLFRSMSRTWLTSCPHKATITAALTMTACIVYYWLKAPRKPPQPTNKPQKIIKKAPSNLSLSKGTFPSSVSCSLRGVCTLIVFPLTHQTLLLEDGARNLILADEDTIKCFRTLTLHSDCYFIAQVFLVPTICNLLRLPPMKKSNKFFTFWKQLNYLAWIPT